MTTPNKHVRGGYEFCRCNYCDGTVYPVKGIMTCDACGIIYNLVADLKPTTLGQDYKSDKT